jgi:hypothetical protein
MRETGKNGYQSIVKKRIKKEFPLCEVHKLDPNDIPGTPDILILCPLTWATLEVKKNKKANKQPNQEFYVEKHNSMSFSSFIYPENEEEVFSGLKDHFKANKK